MKRIVVVILSVSFCFCAAYWAAPTIAKALSPGLEIVRITPAGDDVSELRQIVFEFDRPVVALGDMKRSASEMPIRIQPQVPCEWRWLNQTTLSCNLDEKGALKEATNYEVTISPGIKALDNSTLNGAHHHSFTTSLPAIMAASVDLWKSETHPQIKIRTNQDMTPEALEKALVILDGSKTVSKVSVKEVVELDWEGKPRRDSIHKVFNVEPTSVLAKGTSLALYVNPGLRSNAGPLSSVKSAVLLNFDTYEDFAFVGVQCESVSGTTMVVKDLSAVEKCDPNGSTYLLFNAPVSEAAALRNVTITPQAPGYVVDQNDEDAVYTLFYALSRNHKKTDVYKVRLPRLQPYQNYRISLKQQNELRDVFERRVSSATIVELMTDHRKPHYVMPYRYAVLELEGTSDIPVQVTNIQTWQLEYSGVSNSGAIEKQTHTASPEAALDKTISMPLKIREKVLNQSGAIYAQFTTSPSVRNEADFLFVEVTPYQVHMKLGHFNSVVWVTDLATGLVVPHAKVTLYETQFPKLSDMTKTLATATTDENGIAVVPGLSVIDPKLKRSFYQYRQEDRKHFFVRVDKDAHMALLPLVDDFETSTYRASNGSVYGYHSQADRHSVAWGATAQGIYRLGDTVQYKIYVREQNNEVLKAPRKKGCALKVMDPMGKIVHEVPSATLNNFGAMSGEFVVPRNGVAGSYQFMLACPGDVNFDTMSVLVTDFTPAPFKVSQDVNGDFVEAGSVLRVTTHAKMHSGGAFSDAPVRVTARLESGYFAPNTQGAKNFNFASYSDEFKTKELADAKATLNQAGEHVTDIQVPTADVYFGHIQVESEVQDDRGKSISASSKLSYSSVDRFVGLKTSESFSKAGNTVQAEAIVVDAKGKATPNVQVLLTMEKQHNTLARIKDVGNTYTTHVATTWSKAGECLTTYGTTPATCVFNAKDAGQYRVIASIRDTKARWHRTTSTVYVWGPQAVVWDEKNENFLDIVAEKQEATVGETARFFIKNPYKGAKALITVERYGVLDRFVRTLDSNSAVIEIPIKPDYVPGFFLSVTIQSPRVSQAPKSGVDLGKPTFSMGYIQVPVVDRYKAVVVTAKAEQEVYKPKDKVRVAIHANTRAGKEPIEVAVAVVDEAVFDMVSGGEQNYDPYHGLYRLGSLDLTNFSLLTRLITRQAVETKGANPGGGGGDFGAGITARSNFKMLSYWNPSLVLDANGNGQIEFEAPDNLTGWRVLAMAVTATDKAGFGSAKFKVNRTTEIRPAMPNQVVEGDSFDARFSVMNRSDKVRDLQVVVQVSGHANAKPYVQSMKFGPYERQNVSVPVRAQMLAQTRDLDKGAIRFVVKAGDALDTDGLEHQIPVEKSRSLETVAVYGTTVENSASVDLAFPNNIYTDVGSVDVSVSTSVIASVEGAFRYLRDYPYTCWEQKLTKGVMADNYERLKAYIPATFKWPGSATLAQETLDMANGFQAPSGGMAYFVASDAHVDPYLSAYTALSFEWLRQSGKRVPAMVEKRLHEYLLRFLKEDRGPDYYSPAMIASVRATALFALAASNKVNASDLRRVQPHLQTMDLFGQAHFLNAALLLSGTEDLVAQGIRVLMGHSTQTSGKFLFSDSSGDEFDRMLGSSLRSNCAALDALVTLSKKKGMDAALDVPMKLVRSISESRKSRDYYENTQENMFCMQALANYAQVYEAAVPNMKVSAQLKGAPFGEAALVGKAAKPVLLSRPLQPSDPGTSTKVNLVRKGEGRLYYSAALTTASKDAGMTKVNAGMSLTRTYSVWRDKKWVALIAPVKLQRGEQVQVNLALSLPRPGNFVVVNDPIPGAFEPMNADLATSGAHARVDAGGFYHHELLNDVARFYSDYLPAGTYALSYTVQVIGEGTFRAMPPLAQEMYDPDVFGKDIAVLVEVR